MTHTLSTENVLKIQVCQSDHIINANEKNKFLQDNCRQDTYVFFVTFCSGYNYRVRGCIRLSEAATHNAGIGHGRTMHI